MSDRGTADERRRTGRASGRRPRSAHGDWDVEARDRDPIAVLEEQARDACPGARAGALRAHGRVAVRVLPRRRRDHGDGPVDHAGHRAHGAGVRRRPRRQLRHVRHARAQHRVRHQRLRRDRPRPVGVGRQAARHEPARRRPRTRLRERSARRGRARRRARVPRVRRPVRADAHPRRLVRPHHGRRPGRALPEALPRPGGARRHPRAAQGPRPRGGSPHDRPRGAAPLPSRTRRSSCTSTSSNRGWTTSKRPSPTTASR